MDWPTVIFTLLVLLIIREFKLGLWFSSALHPQQINATDTIAGKVIVDEATQNQDKIELRAVTPSTSSGDDPHFTQKVKEATAAIATQPGKGETKSLQGGQAPVLPSTAGHLYHAHNFVLNHPVFNETEEKVLQWLAGSTMSGAEFDARGHVPSCHPGTRITILENLHKWIDDLERYHRIFWLHGPAGVGKSAIIQSLAEGLAKASKLGASLFFSGPNKRNDPALVFPTLAYQLAVRIPRYKEYLRRKMIEDPKLLEKGVMQQFYILIVEPFTDPSFMAEDGTWAILLDGLDECNGEDAQVHIITLIGSLSLQYPRLPLVWFIASRPEAHLQHAFASDDIKGSFEEYDVPANSPEGCRDVEKFLRAKFEEIRQKYKDLIPTGAPWPVEQDITRISGTSLGLFALAATVVRYIEDPNVCDPISQLAIVISATSGLEPGSLSALHAFYSTILDGVPKAMSPILRLLLHFYAPLRPYVLKDVADGNEDAYPLAWIATLFDFQQHTAYGALRRLHSVVKVPPPEDSGRLGIKFYHASFPDYLSREYKQNLLELDMKRWRGYRKMLHEGDSSSYQRTIEGGRPPIQLSWDARFRDGFWDDLWGAGILILLDPIELHSIHLNPQLLLSQVEDVIDDLDKFDFSALIFRKKHNNVFTILFGLADRVVVGGEDIVLPEVFKIVPLRDLDLTRIPEGKLAHETFWVSHERVGDIGYMGPRRQFYRKPEFCEYSHHYINAPPESLHPEWHSITRPLGDLVAKLEQLQSDNPTTKALIVGKEPSKQCVLYLSSHNLRSRAHFFTYLTVCRHDVWRAWTRQGAPELVYNQGTLLCIRWGYPTQLVLSRTCKILR